jgi:hypothetical protein
MPFHFQCKHWFVHECHIGYILYCQYLSKLLRNCESLQLKEVKSSTKTKVFLLKQGLLEITTDLPYYLQIFYCRLNLREKYMLTMFEPMVPVILPLHSAVLPPSQFTRRKRKLRRHSSNICMCVSTQACIHTYTHAHVWTHTCIYTNAHRHKHTYTHSTHIHIYTRMHTYTLACRPTEMHLWFEYSLKATFHPLGCDIFTAMEMESLTFPWLR